MFLFNIIIILFIIGIEKNNTSKKIREMDNDPSCTIKSDRWKREHGLL
jgi:hypothetical protein